MNNKLKGTLAGFGKRTVVIVLLAYLGIALFFYIFQEYFIFPVLLAQRLDKAVHELASPPKGIASFFVDTSDGEKLNVWTSLQPDEKPTHAAIIFHGNGETVARGNFLPFFRSVGVPAFTFDYRGYGRSSGWPSEQGLYLDAEAIFSEVTKRTGLPASKILLLGNSIGSGPAAYLAQKIHPHSLILLAAYSNFHDLVSGIPRYAPFSFVLRYEFPVSRYLEGLPLNCLILAHGKKDSVVPPRHLQVIAQNPKLAQQPIVLESPTAEHNNIYYAVESELKATVAKCLQEFP